MALMLGDVVFAAGTMRPLCRLERLTVTSDGIETLATQVDLEGQLLPLPRLELELVPGQLAKLAHRRPLSQSEQKLFFVILIEASAAYAPATDAIRAALRNFLRTLPQGSQGELWQFGNRVDVPIGFRPLPYLLGLVDRYSAVSEGELQLIKAVRQAESALLALPDREARRVVVLLADGYNPVMERRLFQQVGQDLAARGLPIFPVAFSPRDVRGPLRNLGELARHGAGTVRWARTLADLEPQFAALSRELVAAEVVTFDRRSWRDTTGEVSVRLRCGDGYSNTCQLVVPARRQSWLWLGLGGLLLLVLGSLGAWRLRRRKTQPSQPAAPVFGPALVGRSGSVRGKTIALGSQLTLGIGLSGAQTCSIGAGPAEPLCELRRMDGVGGARYIVTSSHKSSVVFVNGMKLLGAVTLQDHDRLQLGDLAELTFHAQIEVSDSSNIGSRP